MKKYLKMPLPLLLVLVLIIGCKDDTASQLSGTTGLLKFSFETEPGLDNFKFDISSDLEDGAGYYLIHNPDSLPKGTDVTTLIATFRPINSLVALKVDGIEQQSGITKNNFSQPVLYEAYAENGDVKKFKVVVNVAKANIETEKYIFINQTTFSETEVQYISDLFGSQSNKGIAVGLGVIISVLKNDPTTVVNKLNSQLNLSAKYDLPICVKLDAEIWWQHRSDIWNWWDPGKAGYDPDNKDNVEWTDWNRDSAIKLGWLNWGSQIRMLPCPNLMSPKYIEAWQTEITRCIIEIKTWVETLPDDKKDLFGGIVLGWESSIGVSVFHYPNGNSYLDQPQSNDPTYGKTMTDLPSRGVQTIGYAAVRTAGIANSGVINEEMHTEVVRRHLEKQSKTVYDLGIQRKKIFTHCGGWVQGETIYQAALNDYSCPGWSFYNHAYDPKNDQTAMEALQQSDAPYWSPVEWLLQGSSKTENDWISALYNALEGNSQMVVIYNWNQIKNNTNALNAIQFVNK